MSKFGYDNLNIDFDMKTPTNIKALTGLNELKFGATKKEVEAIYGEPSEVEIIEGDEDFSDVEIWFYDDHEFSVFFEKEFDDRCTNFETDDQNAVLFGKNIFRLSEKEIIALLKENGYSDFEAEDNPEEGERLVSFFDAQIDFLFEGKKLAQVSWAVLVNDDENPVWPN